ncbi:MAG: lamin tail domain-containing protein [Verrucomicrobia bacterium]|nr:lamin tail domain-containing protein [Verrucomicrobiota bacterium]
MKTFLRTAVAAWILACGAIGTPAAAAGDMVINEIHYHPDLTTERVEFVELLNRSSDPVDLGGWSLGSAVEYAFPAPTIVLPGQYVVVAEDPRSLETKFGVSALGPWVGKLDNQGDRVVLRNGAGELVDQVDYQLGFPWPTVGDAPGRSIQLLNPALDNDLGGSWRSSQTTPPGPAAPSLINDRSSWRYFKGTREPSSPRDAWRRLGFDDSVWALGTAPIGYGEAFVGTELADMRGGYSTVYLRKTFTVPDPSDIGSLDLEIQFDDGFNAWINGVHVLGQNVSGIDLPFNASASSALESLEFHRHSLMVPAGTLRPGENVIAIQGHNASIGGSSDFFIDARLAANRSSSTQGPTPGRQNSVFTAVAPPQVRQVVHTPETPRSGEPVLVTAKITDPDGVGTVHLLYQQVDPGRYIGRSDPSYESEWQSVAMNDSGNNNDLKAGDTVYSALLPAAVQVHRRLIRYRLRVSDAAGAELTVPYSDDPQPNFAYFVYDGVPGWNVSVRPGRTPVVAYSPEEMGRLPVYHLLSKRSSVEASTWREAYRGDAYKWEGTLVYDGRVYDHVRYRARGGVWRYAMGKNMWKFDFNRGHAFEARDDYGRKFRNGWAKLNLGASIQQGDYLHRGEQGMFESVGYRLFNLAGLESPRTSFVSFRIIDDAQEADPRDQYEGDFWGVYLAIEELDGRFLEEHGMPDGNLYKMENGTGASGADGELKKQGATAVSDSSDLIGFRRAYERGTPSEAWWRSNLDLGRYYSYQAILQGIHHYDVCCGKNYFYFHNPETGLWQVHPWDLDLTWADNMYVGGVTGGTEPFLTRVLPVPAFQREYQNRVREIRDLLFNTDQAWQLIDEMAGLLRGPADGPTILDADRSQWDFNPVMINGSIVNPGKAGHGRFYQKGTPTADFAGMTQLMKDYVVYRAGRILDPSAFDSGIPATPTIEGPPGQVLAIDRLRVRSPSFSSDVSSAGNTQTLRWRVGEVNDPAFRPGDPTRPGVYEIQTVWQSSALRAGESDTTIPADFLRVGHHYRIRAQVADSAGRTSHWSDPIGFIAGEPATGSALIRNLRLTELMYHPPETGGFEFLELHNISPSLEIDLSGARFTRGIDFVFPPETRIPPGAFLIVVNSDPAGSFGTFRSHYGLAPGIPMTGPYRGNLANEGERITLRTASGGLELFDLTYSDGLNWPAAADGQGASLVPIESALSPGTTASLNLPENWRNSARIGGSPGTMDQASAQGSLVLKLIESAGSRLALEFFATANRAYTLEFRDSLIDGLWMPSTRVPAEPGNRTVRVEDLDRPMFGARFYRIKTEP